MPVDVAQSYNIFRKPALRAHIDPESFVERGVSQLGIQGDASETPSMLLKASGNLMLDRCWYQATPNRANIIY